MDIQFKLVKDYILLDPPKSFQLMTLCKAPQACDQKLFQKSIEIVSEVGGKIDRIDNFLN